MEERLFSTGDSNLDLLLTEVYYSGLEDGYDYAQREFSDDDDDDDDDFPRRPKDLEDYPDYNLKHMTRGQMLDALEDEQERAKRNTKKYVKHHGDHEAKKGEIRGERRGRERGKKTGTWIGGILGAVGGGTAGLALHDYVAEKGSKMPGVKGAAVGLGITAAGALAGRAIGKKEGALWGKDAGREEGRRLGSSRGLRYSKEDQHDPDQRAIKLARKMDDEARRRGGDADFEAKIQGGIDKREAARKEAARKAAEAAERRRQEEREDRIRREKMAWEDAHRAQDREDTREARERAAASGGYSFNENSHRVRQDNNNFNW